MRCFYHTSIFQWFHSDVSTDRIRDRASGSSEPRSTSTSMSRLILQDWVELIVINSTSLHHSLTTLPSLTSSLLHLRERLSRFCFFHLSWLFLLSTSLLRRLDRLDYSLSISSLLFLWEIVPIRFLRFLDCFCFRLVSSSSRPIRFSPGDHLQLSLQ